MNVLQCCCGMEDTMVIVEHVWHAGEIGQSHNEKKEIDNIIESREKFRKEKQFKDADKIRDKLNEMNIELIDHKERTIWVKKENIKDEN